MSKFHIVIDSMSTISENFLKNNDDISVISYTISDVSGSLTKDDFSDEQRDIILKKIESGVSQKTSFVPSSQLELFFEDLCKKNKIVIYLCASDGYTGQYKDSCTLTKKFNNLWVINTKSIASTIESMVYELMSLFDTKKDITINDVQKLVDSANERSIILFSPKNVVGMMNSGRVPAILVKLMKLTKTHPLIKCEEKNKPAGNITRKWEEIWDKLMETSIKIYGTHLKNQEIKFVYLYNSLISKTEIAEIKNKISKFFQIETKKIFVRSTPLPILVYTLRHSVGIGITTTNILKKS